MTNRDKFPYFSSPWAEGSQGELIVYQWSVRRRRPSVRRCPHFQTWISLKPVGQSWSNFMCSITGVGERLHNVLGQIGSKLWFPWQQKAPIDLQWGKRCLHLLSVVFYPILLYLQVMRTCIKSRTSSNFGQIGPLTTELAALERLKNFP